MKLLFEFVAIFCTGLFAGAALYANLVEHPARHECGTALAVTEFAPSYRRATVLQVLLAGVAFVAAVAAWVTSSNFAWLVGGILVVAAIPFTLIAILPTNKKLLDPSLDRSSDSARQLLIRWGRLHAVRTVLSLVAFVIFLISILVSIAVPNYTQSLLRAKESVLRQELSVMRSMISQYALDKHKAPKSLDDLVHAGYLEKIPVDPLTGKPDWRVDQKKVAASNRHEPDIPSVHSSSPKTSSNGTAYNTW